MNAFQAQPGAEGDWASDLLLRDSAGKVVYDEDWGEALLDVGTDAKRKRIADKIGALIDSCHTKGFQAVEPDNYDSYTRSGNRLTANNAQAFIKLLSARAHADGLAIAQKNTSELAANRTANGLDFAVAEECGTYDECGDYTSAFGSNVIVIEYTDSGRSKACRSWGSTLSIVQRDVDVSPMRQQRVRPQDLLTGLSLGPWRLTRAATDRFTRLGSPLGPPPPCSMMRVSKEFHALPSTEALDRRQ